MDWGNVKGLEENVYRVEEERLENLKVRRNFFYSNRVESTVRVEGLGGRWDTGSGWAGEGRAGAPTLIGVTPICVTQSSVTQKCVRADTRKPGPKAPGLLVRR